MYKKSLKNLLKTNFFLIKYEEIKHFSNHDLYLGLVFTWIVGMGRYWDDPGAKLAQHLGIGSLAYIFVLSFALWLILKPLKLSQLSYKNMLTFISLTSAPALFYAIPVERFMSLQKATLLNSIFLTVVAIWRVSLLVFYYRRYLQLTRLRTLILSILPLTAIVTSLSLLNLERAVFEVMRGLRAPDPTVNDGAYAIVLLLTLLSAYLVIPAFLTYLFFIYKTYKKKSNSI